MALLSLQQHIARLADLYGEVSWTARDRPFSEEQSTALAPSVKWSLILRGLPLTSPTISEIARDLDNSMDFAAEVAMIYAELCYNGLASSSSHVDAGPDSELVRRVREWYDACATEGCEGCNITTDLALALDGQLRDLNTVRHQASSAQEMDRREDDDNQLEDNQIENDDREGVQLDSNDNLPEALIDNSDSDNEDTDSGVSVLRLWHEWRGYVRGELQPKHW